jgi:thiamine-phosphate pyrophosphorylase
MTETIPRLCYITDRRALEPEPLLPRVLAAVRAGVDVVQIREKDLATRPLLALVISAAEESRKLDTTKVVVNERLDVALAAGAVGVHLGTHSLPAGVVRSIVPAGFLVGVSCHSLGEALAAAEAGADYILFGPIFETPSKLSYGPPLGIENLRRVESQVRVPILALGGITVERIRPSLDAGATGIAGIRIFQNCPSIEDRVRELRSQFPK